MKITLDFHRMNMDEAQKALGLNDNFDLVDSLLYMMDYGQIDPDGKVRDSHNGIKLTMEV